jgi:hypothetical protein
VRNELDGTPRVQPVAIIVSWQPGAGKTFITALVRQARAARGYDVGG